MQKSLEEEKKVSPEKLSFFFFSAIQSVGFLHQNLIYHGNICPEVFHIFSDWRVKLDDLRYSIKFKKESGNSLYPIKGANEIFGLKEA